MLIAIVSGMCFYASVLMATTPAVELELQILNAIGNDSNLLIVFYVQIMPDDFVMQLHRF